MIIDLFSNKSILSKTDNRLIDEIKETTDKINNTKIKFNNYTDSNEIESSIYELKELETHYSFLIKQAKLEKITNVNALGGLWL